MQSVNIAIRIQTAKLNQYDLKERAREIIPHPYLFILLYSRVITYAMATSGIRTQMLVRVEPHPVVLAEIKDEIAPGRIAARM